VVLFRINYLTFGSNLLGMLQQREGTKSLDINKSTVEPACVEVDTKGF
jgi:hypothetical protein